MNALIIDDEVHCRSSLKYNIGEKCPGITILGEAEGVEEGFEMINKLKPNLIFLDIQMRDGTGFDLLDKFEELNFKVVFTTAYDQYAVKAFDYQAIHYLLKPIAPADLVGLNKRLENYKLSSKEVKQLQTSITDKELDSITIRTQHKCYNVKFQNVLYLEADSSYCNFNLKGDQKIVVPRTLKDFEQILPDTIFVKSHKSYLINIHQIESLNISKSSVILKNGKKLPVSRRVKKAFEERILEAGIELT